MIELYIPVMIMALVGLAFGLTNLLGGAKLGVKRPSAQKSTTYESGLEPIKTARERFSVKFYLVAMLFILFDIEIVFMYPWAVQFRQLGMTGLVAMGLFMVLLFSGFIYVIKKGALEWE